MKKLRTTTGKPVALRPIWPNAGVQAWYQSTLDSLINQSTADLLMQIAQAWNKTPPIWLNSHITAFYGDAAIGTQAGSIEAAGVVFRVGDRVLLMRRTDGEGWAFPGGSVELNESVEGAARREAFEETLYAYNGWLDYYHTQEHGRVRFATFTADIGELFVPRLNPEHDAYRWPTIAQAFRLKLHPGVRRTLRTMQTTLAEDAPSPTKALQAALARWGSQTIKRFDLAAQRIADDFAARSQRATQAAMMTQLAAAGFTVKFKPTRESMEAYRVVAAENVGLIRSIPRKYHEQVEQKVWNAVRNGSDLNKLSTELRKAHKVTINRAALIARDQNAKAKAVIERVRQQELGIRRGIWMHSNAGKEPRPLHLKWGHENKQYDLARGMWDADEGEWVHPGQLINCRCTMRPIIDGFED